MKKVLILSSSLSDNKQKFIQLLSSKSNDDIQFELATFKNLTFSIKQNKLEGFLKDKNLNQFDFVYIRKKTNFTNLARTVAVFLEENKIYFADHSLLAASYMGNKLTALSRLATFGIPVADTIYSYNSSKNFASKLITDLGFPIIAKNMTIQRMEGIYVIQDESGLKTFLKKKNISRFLFQKYIEIKDEYRILVIEGKAVSAHTKTKRSYEPGKIDYLDQKEFHQFVDISSLHKNLIREAEKAAENLLIDIAGVDVCTDTQNNVYVIEVNRGPGIDYEDDKPEEINAVSEFFRQKLK